MELAGRQSNLKDFSSFLCHKDGYYEDICQCIYFVYIFKYVNFVLPAFQVYSDRKYDTNYPHYHLPSSDRAILWWGTTVNWWNKKTYTAYHKEYSSRTTTISHKPWKCNAEHSGNVSDKYIFSCWQQETISFIKSTINPLNTVQQKKRKM